MTCESERIRRLEERLKSAEGALRRAFPHQQSECWECRGRGEVDGVPCVPCAGTGLYLIIEAREHFEKYAGNDCGEVAR